MGQWQARIAAGAKRKYLGIVEALEADIYAGYVKAGDQLPTQREIAAQLNVDLTTVTRAFNMAHERGLIEAITGRGTYVRQHVSSKLISHITAQRPFLDLSMNSPPQPIEAALQEYLIQGVKQLVSGADRVLQLQYQDNAGNPEDRDLAAAWLAETNQMTVNVEKTVIAAGAQAALFAILQTLTRVGDNIACAQLVYPGLKSAAACHQVHLVPLPFDNEGILPDAFETACQQETIRALYVVPAMDNPTTVTLSLARRMKLVEVAQRYQVSIIEDDPYSILQETRLPSLVSLVPELCWYIRTLSKCVSPALRIAYVLAPSKTLANQLAGVLGATSVMAPPLMSALAAKWLQDGRVMRFAQAIRAENKQRQQIAKQIFHAFDYLADEQGHHGWLNLPSHWQASDFAREAQLAGVSVVDGNVFSVNGQSQSGVRLSLGVVPDHEEITHALQILVALLERQQTMTNAIV